MLFNSLQYLLFFPVVALVYWRCPGRWRPVFLLLASYVFYASWNPIYILLIWAMTLVNWLFGLIIARAKTTRRLWLILAVVSNIATLGYFKYSNFFLKLGYDAMNAVHIQHSNLVVAVMLPLGISFFTFEFLHYVIDVYKGQTPVQNPIRFALFASFFPSQISGPIKRYQDFVPQIETPPTFEILELERGFVLCLHGLAKKVLLADNLAIFVNLVFAHPAAYSTVDLWLATYAFAFQAYCDFSGYTDVAIGSSLMLGITLPPNFNVPYMSGNIRDFWHRWHMSLSLWLRDYVYLPLGGSRCSTVKTYRNLLLTTTVAGLWHGAAMHFVSFGVFHGLALIAHREWLRQVRRVKVLEQLVQTRFWQAAAVFITFHTCCIAYVLFRASTIPASLAMIGRMLMVWELWPTDHPDFLTSQQPLIVPLLPVCLACLFISQVIAELAKHRQLFGRAPRWLQAAYCSALIFLMLTFQPDQANQFIYFQF